MNKLLAALISTSVVIGGWIAYSAFYHNERPFVTFEPVTHFPFDSSTIDPNIRNNEQAVGIDPYGALGWSMMSGAYMWRSRESDDLATAVKAEKAARRSLTLRTWGNVGAWKKLIESLLQEHRFKDALGQCEAAKKAGIYSDDTVLSHVDCLIEIGRYDEAGVLVSKNPRAFDNASGKSVIARLLDIGGKPDQAVSLLRAATAEVDVNAGMPSNAIGWFHTRLGLELSKTGKHEEAQKQFETALALYPRDYKAMAGLARLAFQQRRWNQAIDWGTRSDAVAQMADVRALVGDSYAMLGDETRAQEWYSRVASLVGRPSGMNDGLHEVSTAAGTHGHRLDRQYALYCADHGRDPEGAYAAALRDFETRHDVYAYDTLAWVCLQKGDKPEALKGIDKALERGTKDPMLWYHAGAIYSAVGSREKASFYLKGALSMDPQFDGIAAPKAASLLVKLGVR